MTIPGPLREEEIARVLEQAAVDTLPTQTEGLVRRHDLYRIMAAAVIARLRPAWEQLEAKQARTQEWLDKFQGAASEEALSVVRITKERDALRADLARKEQEDGVREAARVVLANFANSQADLAACAVALTDAVEIRSTLGFLLMRMAVAKDKEDAYTIAERELREIRPALDRFDAWRDSPQGRAALARVQALGQEGGG